MEQFIHIIDEIFFIDRLHQVFPLHAVTNGDSESGD
jgi:hypothetical protein